MHGNSTEEETGNSSNNSAGLNLSISACHRHVSVEKSSDLQNEILDLEKLPDFEDLITFLMNLFCQSEYSNDEFYSSLLRGGLKFAYTAQAASIWVSNEEELQCAAQVGYRDSYAPLNLANECLTALKTNQKKFFLVKNRITSGFGKVEKLSKLAHAKLANEEVRVTLCIPSYNDDGNIVSILALDSFSRPHEFDAIQKKRGEALGRILGAYIQRLGATKSLTNAYSQFKETLMAIPIPTAAIRANNGKIVWSNEAFSSSLCIEQIRPIWLENLKLRRCRGQNVDEVAKIVEIAIETDQGLKFQCTFSEISLAYLETSLIIVFLQPLCKEEAKPNLEEAIKSFISDSDWFSQALVSKVSEMQKVSNKRLESRDGLLEPLTPREEKVLKLISRGYKDAEIVKELNIKLSTVRNYIGKIYGKLGVHSRTEAVFWARDREFNQTGNYIKNEVS